MSTSTTKKSRSHHYLAKMSFLVTSKPWEMDSVIKENDMDQKYWHYEFKQLYLKAWNKLDKIVKEHECADFLEDVRVFDPSQLSSSLNLWNTIRSVFLTLI